MTAQVKLQKKYVGRKVILADGTKTNIATMMATCFKTEDGTKLKVTELKELGSGTLKQISADKPARGSRAKKVEEKPKTRRGQKESTSSRGKKVEEKSTRRGSKAQSSGRGRPATVEVLDNYSEATRRQCQNYLKHVAGIYDDVSEMADMSLGELRIECNEHLGVKSKKPKTKAKANSKVAGAAKAIAEATKKNVLSKVKAKTTEIKRRISRIEDEVEQNTIDFSEFDQKIVDKIHKVIHKRIAPMIRKRTGLDVSLAVTYSMFSPRRCTLQIGLMPTDASDKEIRAYNTDITEANQRIEDEDIPDTANEFDDDLGEFDAALDTSDSEESEEESEEEFDAEEEQEAVDVGAVVSALSKQIGTKDKRLTSTVEAWFDNPEIEETFGEDVKIGTELISNKSGNTLVVSGFDNERNKVCLYNIDEQKFTYADLVTVAKMDYAEDVASSEEEEIEEEDDEEEFSE